MSDEPTWRDSAEYRRGFAAANAALTTSGDPVLILPPDCGATFDQQALGVKAARRLSDGSIVLRLERDALARWAPNPRLP